MLALAEPVAALAVFSAGAAAQQTLPGASMSYQLSYVNLSTGSATPLFPGQSAVLSLTLLLSPEPGTAGTCLPDRIAIAAACAAELPVIVDGGVTEEVAPLCVTAGVESMVVGRALLAPAKGSVK